MAKRHGNKIGDFESLFLRLEELVLANSGEDEFEEVFKLLVAKLWDERTGKARRFGHIARASKPTTRFGSCFWPLRRRGRGFWRGQLNRG